MSGEVEGKQQTNQKSVSRKLSKINWGRGGFRLWICLAVPWTIFFLIAAGDELAGQKIALAELSDKNWCPSHFKSLPKGFAPDSTIYYFSSEIQRYCHVTTPQSMLNRASGDEPLVRLTVATFPFIFLLGFLILKRVGLWVFAGFRPT